MRLPQAARRKSGLVSETRQDKIFILCKDGALLDSVEHLAVSLKWKPVTESREADALLVVLEPRPADAVNEIWDFIVQDVQAKLDEGREAHYDHLVFYSPGGCKISATCIGLGTEHSKRRRFLTESFSAVDACQGELPGVMSKISDQIKNTEDAGARSYISRLGSIAKHAGKKDLANEPRYSWARDAKSVMDKLAGKAGDRESRLDQEHDVVTAINIASARGSLVEEQAAIDYYYLAASSAGNRTKKTVVCIDDQPDQFLEFLELLSVVTGDIIFYTADDMSARACISSMSAPSACLSGVFKKIGDATNYGSDEIGHVDWILMDLLIKDTNGKRRITGFDALARYMERSPETPAILLTWSEETDVAAEALRKSNAVCVVPKRRILRVPYEMRRYMNDEVGPILDCLGKSDLQRRMLKAFRLWTTYPGILWHGEKTFHAVEHTLEHSLGLWKMSNQLLAKSWNWISSEKPAQYTPELLFRFLMAVWLHDIGHKGNETYQMADEVRSRHAWISGELVHRNPELFFLRRDQEGEAEFISLLCAYHGSNAPFRHGSTPKDSVLGLFQRSLEDIETDSGWKLMGWTALLRLLDAIEHNWKRVGDAKLLEAKKVSIEMDLQYYTKRSRESVEAKEYAKLLRDQYFHMRKHRSVLDVEIKVMHRPDEKLVVFWPVFTFTSHEAACEFLPEIGTYALKEWFDPRSETGEILQDRMALSLLHSGDLKKHGKHLALPNEDSSCRYAVWIPSTDEYDEWKRLAESIEAAEKIEGTAGETLKRDKSYERDELARRLWMPNTCSPCITSHEETKR